ncbi:MAG: hypothetical protein RBT47_06460 [Anaerolineae bacterium]|jgi:hypothetical protein|nr:hypothetical protein [Anaerolineae bacterium]
MRTPDGRECPYYFADIYRWRVGEDQCRLLTEDTDIQKWTSKLCATCPVPEICRANSCPNMKLHAQIQQRPLRFWEGPRMVITATCSQIHGHVANPYVGCSHCHKTLTFVVGEDEEKKSQE